MQELKLRNPDSGAFTITLLSAGMLHTFDFDTSQRLVSLPSWAAKLGDGGGETPVSLDYFEIGREKKVVEVVFGNEKALSYDKAASLAAEKSSKDRNSAIGFGVMGVVLISLGGLARLARGNSHLPTAASSGALLWLVFYGLMLVVMLTEPAILHRAFGAETFHLPIEYALPVALALLLLPLWPGCMGPYRARATGDAQRQRRQAGHDPGDAVGAGLGQSCRAANGYGDALVLCLFRIACWRLDCLCGHARYLSRSVRILTHLDDRPFDQQ